MSASRLQAVHIGCSGWNYRSWRGTFYPAREPARRWLESYASCFDTVEVNTTFYRLIARAAVERWVEHVPRNFVFAVKASRYLTHVKRLAGIDEGVARFYERITPLRAAGLLGPVLWQLPENFHRDDERLAGALALAPAGRHAFEFRHESWFAPEVYALLRAHGAALVIGDHPQRPFQTLELTAPFTFVRFHYGHRGRRGNYSRSELEEWAGRLHALRRRAELFVYFNNDWEAFAPRNAQALRGMLTPVSNRSQRVARSAEVMSMATTRQRAAAKRNVKKAQAGARRKQTLEHLPAKTKKALGEEANKVRRGETETRSELEAKARRLEIRGRSKMGKDELRRAIARAS